MTDQNNVKFNDEKKRLPTRRESAMMGLAISCKSIANEVEQEFKSRDVNVQFTDRAIARVGQIVSETVMKHYVRDVFAFASHGKRVHPNTNDIKLLYRRNPEVQRRVEGLLFDNSNNQTPSNSIPDAGHENPQNRQETTGESDKKNPEARPKRKISNGKTNSVHSTTSILKLNSISSIKNDENMKVEPSDDFPVKNDGILTTTELETNELLDRCVEAPAKKPKIAITNNVDSFYDDEAGMELAKQLCRKVEVVKKDTNQVKLQIPSKSSTNKDSFYGEDDEEWIELFAAKTKTTNPTSLHEIKSKKASSSTSPDNVQNPVDYDPKNLAVQETNQKATKSPFTSTSNAITKQNYPPTPVLPGDWFQPELHSTPLNASVHQKHINETLNLSFDTTPQRRANFPTPKEYNVNVPAVAKRQELPRLGGLFKPKRKSED